MTSVGSSEQTKLEWCLLGQGGQGTVRKKLEESSGTPEGLLSTWTMMPSCGHSLANVSAKVYAHCWVQKQDHTLPCPSQSQRLVPALRLASHLPGSQSLPTCSTVHRLASLGSQRRSEPPASSGLVTPFLLSPMAMLGFLTLVHTRMCTDTHTHTR